MPPRTSAISVLHKAITYHFFSTSTIPSTVILPQIRVLSKIPPKYRAQAYVEAQEALTDYFHLTSSLSFTYAEQIIKNSPVSLSSVVSKVPFCPSSSYGRSLQRFLRYHPVNEFEFFYESIGIDYHEINGLLPADKLFLSEDSRAFDVACLLAGFGFPWNKLGMLYKEEALIFSREIKDLNNILSGLLGYGFSNAAVVGICLVFPFVLRGSPSEAGQIDSLLSDLKCIFVEFDLCSSVECNVDSWLETCQKIRLFYDLGCEKGTMGELLGSNKNIFIEYSQEALAQRIDFFCNLHVKKQDIGILLLSKPEILGFNLEDRVISVSGFLKHFGLGVNKLKRMSQEYAYVFGRNKIVNVPHIMRSLNLSDWFFDRIRDGCHHLLGTYVIESPDEDLDKDYVEWLQKLQFSRVPHHTIRKLNFLHGIGFGENKLTIRVLNRLSGSSSELQERVLCLLHHGVEFSKLCRIISSSPKILNQKPESLEKKLKFLCQDMESSVQYLYVFPAYLCYHLEKRIEPRYKFCKWLQEQGLCPPDYAFATMIATSEKTFTDRLQGFHPDAPKMWLEYATSNSRSKDCR